MNVRNRLSWLRRNTLGGQHGITRYVVSILLTAGTTLLLWLLRDHLTTANFAVIYLLTVLIIAIFQGTGPSLLAALLSFLCFNFFLVPPFYTFLVADSRDILDLVVYAGCAALGGQLAAYARKQANIARQRAYEQNVLYGLTSTFNQITTADRAHAALLGVLGGIESVIHVAVLPQAELSPAPQQTTSYLLLQADDDVFGVLRVVFDRAPSVSLRRLIAACAAQTAMVLQRIALSDRARRGESLAEADRLKTALLHAVSHDLRTPITIIKTSATNLLNLHDTVDASERVEMLKMIEHQADHLNNMVGNLLDLSRLRAGALPIKYGWNSLEEVAGEVAAEVFNRDKHQHLKIDFPEDMPLVSCDFGLMLQVLSNLVENSLRYEPPGGCLEILGEYDGVEARVKVRNHGPDIEPSERAQLMEPFYTGKGGNIGLGLAIAKGIIEAHHGRIWVEDTPGGGATFVFALQLGNPPMS